MTSRTIRAATSADVPALATVLTRAFLNESPFTWIQPDDGLRARVLPVLFEGVLRYINPIERGTEVLFEGDAMLGGAVWAPPGRWKATPLQQLRMVPGLISALGMAHVKEYGRRGNAVEDALHRAHPREPHWYLAALGVAPDAHNKGMGTALVLSGLQRCDRAGAPAYLECREVLVPYYERFGFKVTGSIELPEGASDQVSMWRSRAG